MAAKQWTGSTTSWNTAGNWTPSGVPQNGDDVTFDTGSQACTLDVDTNNLASLTFTTGYSAAFNANGHIITTSGNVGINSTSVSFSCALGNATHSIGGNLSLATTRSVTFSGTLNITGTFTNSAATRSWSGNISCTDYTISGTSSVLNSGTITITGDFTAGSSNSYSWGTLKLNGTSKNFNAFYNNIITTGDVEVNGSYTLPNTTDYGLSANTITIKNGGTLTNSNTQTLVSAYVGFDVQSGGTYAGAGSLLVASNDTSTPTITVTGTWSNTGTTEASNNILLTSTNGSSHTLAGTWNFLQDGASGGGQASSTLTFDTSKVFVFSGVVNISCDTANTYNVVNNATSLEFQNTFTMLNGSGGTFNYTKSSGTLLFTGAAKTITLLTGKAYENLSFSMTGTKTLGGNPTITCENLTLGGNASANMAFGTSTININGNWTSTAMSTSASFTGTPTINLNGSSKNFTAWSITGHNLKTINVNGSYTVPTGGAAGFKGMNVENLTVANGGTLTNSTGADANDYISVYPNGAGVTSSLTVASGGTFTQNGNLSTLATTLCTVTISGTFGGSGTTTFRINTTLTSGNSSQTVGSTVNFTRYFTSVSETRTATLGAVAWTFTGDVTFDNNTGAGGSGTFAIVNNATSIEFQKALTISSTSGQTVTYTKSSGSLIFTTNTATISLLNKTYEAFSVTSGAKTFSGTFTTGAFSVTGGSVNLSGLTLTASSLTISYPASVAALGGASLTTTGNVTMSGTSGTQLALNPNSGWTLNCGGAGTFGYANVKNCNASGGTEIDATNNCDDQGSNTNVNFTSFVAVTIYNPASKPAFAGNLKSTTLSVGLLYDCPLWETSGQIVNTNVQNANLVGAGTSLTRAASPYGESLTGGSFLTGYSSALNVSGNITIAALVKFTGAQTAKASPLRRGTGTGASATLWGFECQSTSSIACVAKTSSTVLKSVNFTFTAGTWYHLAGVINPTAGTISLYVNGSLDATSSVGAFSYDTTTTGRIIGLLGEGSVAFSGALAGGWVWSRALTADEIQTHAIDPWQFYRKPRYFKCV